MRENMTLAENFLWKKLQCPPFSDYRFRRQHPIQKYIVDFYSHKLRLVIEVDGKYHNTPEQIKQDQERTDVLEFNGLSLLRFTNEDVMNNTSGVLDRIEKKIDSIKRLE